MTLGGAREGLDPTTPYSVIPAWDMTALIRKHPIFSPRRRSESHPLGKGGLGRGGVVGIGAEAIRANARARLQSKGPFPHSVARPEGWTAAGAGRRMDGPGWGEGGALVGRPRGVVHLEVRDLGGHRAEPLAVTGKLRTACRERRVRRAAALGGRALPLPSTSRMAAWSRLVAGEQARVSNLLNDLYGIVASPGGGVSLA
jgi:hypothetical protein